MDRSSYPYAETRRLPGGGAQDYLEPLSVLAWLAQATTKVRIGTSVLVIPYRNPVLAAKMLATIDQLSKGRVILGAGVGWLREEFEALATAPFDERGAVTDEYVQLMRAAWTTDPVSFDGRFYKLAKVHALPKPVQRAGIPVWIGGHTDAAVKRAGTLGDAWHPIGLRPPALLHPDEYRTKAEQVRAWARRAGRDPKAVELTLRVPMAVRPSRDKAPGGERPMFQGTAGEVIADVQTYQRLGVTHFVFDPTVPELRGVLANLERFATDVRPKVMKAPRT
jgi:probable F420-dependent oxidoreductase